MPFQTELCDNAPMRPPTRQLSNNFTIEHDDDEVASTSVEKKDILSSNHSRRTCATETDSSSDEESVSRHVRFAMTAKKYLIESHKTFSKEEIANSWYSREEQSKRTSKIQKIVARMEAGKPEKKSTPSRGLDCWTEKGVARLDKQINNTLNAVMDEQDQQWFNDTVNYARIASLSQNVTAVSVQRALNIGYEDEMEAAEIYGAWMDTSPGNFADADDGSVASMASLAASKKRRTGRKKSSDSKPRRAKRSGSRKADRQDSPRKTSSKKRTSKKKQ